MTNQFAPNFSGNKRGRRLFPPAFSLLLALAVLLAGFGLAGCHDHGATGAKAGKYHCPMHPTYISDKAGDCPICGMKLVPIKEAQPPAGTNAPAAKAVKYTCPMHPNIVSNAPGVCPECNMKLVPMKEEAAAPAPGVVPGRTAVMLSAEKEQLIGLRTEKAETRALTNFIHATAVVQHDETRFAKVSLRFNGWIQSLKVNYVGQFVEQGDPMMTVYSPELFVTENEYLMAFRNLAKAKKDSVAALTESAQRLLDSTRRRLELWQIGDEEIRALEQRGTPSDQLLVRAPTSGHVIAKTAVEGKAFMAGETLFEVADLHRVWVRVAVFESDFPRIKVGETARVTFPSLGHRTFESTITFIYPHFDPQTRRGEVRIELDNPGHILRPDMWGSVEIVVPVGQVLTVPASAVLDTGERYVAFVKRADAHLEPRELKIGAQTDGYWEVQSGLKEGESVVTRALFLVDSESQLKAAISAMSGGGEQ